MNEIVARGLELLRSGSFGWLSVALVALNVVVFFAAVAAGRLLVRLFAGRPVNEPAPTIGASEMVLAAGAVLINSGVTIVGLWLFRSGVIEVRASTWSSSLLDFLVLFFVMDGLMYGLHRLAHAPILYSLLHRTHHLYDRPRPLTLFVLHPAEVVGFGALWLIVVSVYDASWAGIALYLTLNVVFGTVGHLGVEPLPEGWTRRPLVGSLTGATFHGQHHGNPRYNYGFYTTIWDRLFGTLGPDYARRLDAAARGEAPRAFP